MLPQYPALVKSFWLFTRKSTCFFSKCYCFDVYQNQPPFNPDPSWSLQRDSFLQTLERLLFFPKGKIKGASELLSAGHLANAAPVPHSWRQIFTPASYQADKKKLIARSQNQRKRRQDANYSDTQLVTEGAYLLSLACSSAA